MLYYFPNESPEELLVKERLKGEEEVRRAARVETHGYRRREPILQSSYIEWRCIHEYLQCPIKKWSWPVTSKDKVDLEALPTDFLPPLRPYKPLMFYDPVLKQNIRRMVGYREILRKREYVEYLKDIESYDNCNFANYTGELRSTVIEKTPDEVADFPKVDENASEEIQSQDKDDNFATHHHPQVLRLARGGGKDDKGKKDAGKGKGDDKAKGADKGKGDDKKKGKGDDNKDGKKGKDKDKKDRGPTATALKPGKLVADAKKLEKEHKANLEEVFKYHQLYRVPIGRERDAEWLLLSDTDPSEASQTITTFSKEPEKWMKEELSFESQYLVRTLRLYMWSSWLTGRAFFGIRADYERRRMEFTHRIRDMFFFFITSIFCCLAFCIIVVSFITIKLESANTNTGGTDTGNKEHQQLVDQNINARREVEELELEKYDIPLYVTMINLSLVAVWSSSVIYKDRLLIIHYFNCWATALAEMETSGCLGIVRKVYLFHVVFFLFTGLNVTMFYFDYPAHIRANCGLIVQLIIRPFKRDIRIESEEVRLPFQIAGFVFQVYVAYCAGSIKLLMQILALILKNASEMWNFKFALTFNQLSSKTRGQVLRLGLNHSLSKLFLHHRVLTVLLRNFGQVFSLPIMVYMVCEMGVVTLTMVRIFFYKAATAADYGGTDSVSIKTKNRDTTSEIRIPYFHSPSEDYLIYFLMVVQLIFQFMFTSEVLSKAGNAFYSGYEFVRRSGTILCKNSHQRRLIQSLEWSFSSTDPSVLSANAYFAINRSTILSAWAAVIGFFSLIIQLQVKREDTIIRFPEPEQCRALGSSYVLDKGLCMDLDAQ